MFPFLAPKIILLSQLTCLEDCNDKYGMKNCAALGCAASTASCITGLAEIGIDTALGIGEAVGFFASAGASTAAKPALKATRESLKDAVKKVGSSVLKSGANSAADFIKKEKKTIIDEAVKKIKKHFILAVPNEVLVKTCSAVADALIE